MAMEMLEKGKQTLTSTSRWYFLLILQTPRFHQMQQMNRYLCQLCNRIVTYGEKHPCFFHKNDDNVHSLQEPDEFGRVRTKHAANHSANSNEIFEKSFPETQQINTKQPYQLSTMLVERSRQVSLVNTSETKTTFCCFSDKISLKELPTDTLISGSLSNVHSRTMPSKESQPANFLSSSKSFEPASRPQGDICGASKRKSRLNKSFIEINEAVENDSNSFHAESIKVCKTLCDESKYIVFNNGKTCFSKTADSSSKQVNLNSKFISEASNSHQGGAFPRRMDDKNEILTGISRDSTDVPIFSEVILQDRKTRGLLIVNKGNSPNPIKDQSAVAGPSGISTHLLKNPKKVKFNNDLSGKEVDFKSKPDNYSLTHTGKKQIVCDVCKRGFHRKDYLKLHYKMHTGKTPFVCNVCKKEFSRKADLIRHYKIHTGEKPFVCDVCKTEFSRKERLKMHYRIHTGEKPFVCDKCYKMFARKDYLVSHYTRRHSNKKP